MQVTYFIIVYHHKGAQRGANHGHQTKHRKVELEKVCKTSAFQGRFGGFLAAKRGHWGHQKVQKHT